MSRVVGFTNRDARVLTDIVDRQLAGEYTPLPGDYEINEAGPFMHYAKTQSGGVTAREDNTPGSGTVNIYRNENGTLTDTGLEQVVYNIASAAVAGDTFVIIGLGPDDWCVLVEDCGS